MERDGHAVFGSQAGQGLPGNAEDCALLRKSGGVRIGERSDFETTLVCGLVDQVHGVFAQDPVIRQLSRPRDERVRGRRIRIISGFDQPSHVVENLSCRRGVR